MREYIRNKIFNTIKAIVFVSIVLFSFKSSNLDITSLTIALNSNLTKNVDKQIIEEKQKELFVEGLYNPKYSFTGDLTGYVGDCPLCSGYLACPPRTNVLKKGIYYNDKTYGTLRIVASSKNYPCGTVISFKVNKLSSEPIIAIILDRGVGGNDIDLLTDSLDKAVKNIGRVRDLEFNVLREGWKR